MTTPPNEPPWGVARRLYADALGATSTKAVNRQAIDWDGESEDFPGEPASGDFFLHHLLFLNIQAQGEVARRLEALNKTLKEEAATVRRGLGKLIQRAEWIHEAIPDDEDDDSEEPDDEEDDNDEEHPTEGSLSETAPSPAPAPRGPRLIHRPSKSHPHPVADEEADHAS